MPRPTNRSRSQRVAVREAADVGRLTPVAQSASSVAASTRAGTGAQDLAVALGIGAVGAKLYDNNQEQKAATAVARGTVTRDNLESSDESGRFVFHANKTLRKREAKDVSAQLAQKYAEEFPKDGTDAELEQWWTDNVQETFQGIDDDDVAVMAPVLDRARDGLIQNHTQTQVRETVAKLEESATFNTIDMFSDPEESYSETRSELTTQFGTERANQMLAESFVEAVSAARTPEDLEAMVAKAPRELRENPKYSAGIAKAIATVQDAHTIDERMLGRAASETDVKNGSYTVDQAREDVVAGVYTEEIAGNKLAMSLANLERKTDINVSAAAMLRGEGGYLTEQKDRQEALAIAAVEHSNALGINVEESAFRLGLVNGTMFEPHKDQMKNATLANPEGFSAGYAKYMQYHTADPKFTAANVPEAQQYLFDTFRTLTEDLGLDEKSAMERIRNGDPETARALLSNRDNREILETALADVRDLPWTPAELLNSPVLYKGIRDRTLAYLSMGGFSVEQATQMAAENMKTNRVVVDGHSFSYSQGWPTEDTDTFVDHIKTKLIPEGEDPDDYTISPDYETKSTTDAYIIRNGDLPFGAGNMKFNIGQASAEWQEGLRNDAADAVIHAREVDANSTMSRLKASGIIPLSPY